LETDWESYFVVKPFFRVDHPIFHPDIDVRLIALWILNTLGKKGRTLDFLFEIVHNKRSLSQKDRSLLKALVFCVLKWRGFLDTIITYFSNIRIEKTEINILNILRIELFQIIYLSKIPPAAAVHTADMTPPGLPVAARSLVNDHGFLKTFPHLHHMDGFFAVCMKRGG
tara:strand:- start:1573 stop:2079 length:507 start_codon:yes stop_codon:yes gene_type:complete